MIVDEFVTAMIEADRFDIPIRLADAPQDDTLNSFKQVISVEVFDPRRIIQGASLLVLLHSFLSISLDSTVSLPKQDL